MSLQSIAAFILISSILLWYFTTIQSTRTLYFQGEVNTSVDQVFEHLIQPKNFLGLQPLLISVENIKKINQTTTYYEAVELFNFYIISIHNRIKVEFTTVKGLNDPHIYFHVESPGSVTIDSRLQLIGIQGRTKLQYEFKIDYPFYLQWLVISSATNAQETLLKNLAARLDEKIE